MKAQLILKQYNDCLDDTDNGKCGDEYLSLSLVQDRRFYYKLEMESAKDNKEDYLYSLGEIINKAQLIMNAIPGLKLIVDQSVCEFIEGEEEEIRKFVSMLITEI